MDKIVFVDVGRGRWCGEVSIMPSISSDPNAICEQAYRVIKSKLATRFPDVSYNAETNEGIIEAGYHVVGKFSVQKEER